MQFFALLVPAFLASLAAAEWHEVGQDCGDNYGWETCGNTMSPTFPEDAVVVCNDMHVWAVRQNCGNKWCCREKSGGGAYCIC